MYVLIQYNIIYIYIYIYMCVCVCLRERDNSHVFHSLISVWPH
jgi:hypothetical protein